MFLCFGEGQVKVLPWIQARCSGRTCSGLFLWDSPQTSTDWPSSVKMVPPGRHTDWSVDMGDYYTAVIAAKGGATSYWLKGFTYSRTQKSFYVTYTSSINSVLHVLYLGNLIEVWRLTQDCCKAVSLKLFKIMTNPCRFHRLSSMTV